jgi:co-chaperonin GroES (HSP10)
MKLEAWMNQIKPVLTRICAIPIEKQRTTVGGLVLPEGSYEAGEMEWGKVFAVGPGTYEGGTLQPVDVEVGEVIRFCRVSKLQEDVFEGHRFFCVDVRDLQYRVVEANNG